MQPNSQQRRGNLGVLAVYLIKVAHLIQHKGIRLRLPDVVVFLQPWGAVFFLNRFRALGWCGKHWGILCGRNCHFRCGGHLPYLLLDLLREMIVIEYDLPVGVDVGNGLIVPVDLLQPVPDIQTVARVAVAQVVRHGGRFRRSGGGLLSEPVLIFTLQVGGADHLDDYFLPGLGFLHLRLAGCFLGFRFLRRLRLQKHIQRKLFAAHLHRLGLLFPGEGTGSGGQRTGGGFLFRGGLFLLSRLPLLCPGVFSRLLQLPLRLQGLLRQRVKEGRRATGKGRDVPKGHPHGVIASRIGWDSGKVTEHGVGQLGYRRGIVQKLAYRLGGGPCLCLLGIRGGDVRVRVVVIELNNTAGEIVLFIFRQERLFLLVEIPPILDKAPDALFHLVPTQADSIIVTLGEIVLPGQLDALAVVPLVKAGIAEAANAILIPQEADALAGIVALHEIGVDAQLALGHAAAPEDEPVQLVLGDEIPGRRGKVLDSLELCHRPVQHGYLLQQLPRRRGGAEAQQAGVLCKGSSELVQLAHQFMPGLGVPQYLGNPQLTLRGVASNILFIYCWEVALLDGLVTEILAEEPQRLCQLLILILPRVVNYTLAGILSVLQQSPDPGGHLDPGHRDLAWAKGGPARGNVKALGIEPDCTFLPADEQPLAAGSVLFFQKRGGGRAGGVLLEESHDALRAVTGVAGAGERPPNHRVRHRAGRRVHGQLDGLNLCLRNALHLFLHGGKELERHFGPFRRRRNGGLAARRFVFFQIYL